MKKFGIITHYHKSLNYGGVLQAYALTAYLNSLGVEAKQIKYRQCQCFKARIKKMLKDVLLFIAHPVISIKKISKINRFSCFRSKIPHFTTTITQFNLNGIEQRFDVLITGSDQVWHPNVICDAYCLNIPTDCFKVSYSASVATKRIPSSKYHYYKLLNNLDVISVREQDSIPLLKQFINKEIKVCCDPVFLINKADWVKLAKTKKCCKKYIFCYFIGSNDLGRFAANYISKKEGYSIINISHISGFNPKDYLLKNNKQILNAGPAEFLGLIHDAELVLTDSFHATAFSIIFNKKFLCFQRDDKIEMENRLFSLLTSFNYEDRIYLNDHKTKFDTYYNNYTFKESNNDKIINKYRFSSIEFLDAIIKNNGSDL